MRKLAPALSLLLLLVSAWPADGCGDKLLVLGRGASFPVEVAEFRSSIVFYVNPNTPGSQKIQFNQFPKIMEQAGHIFRVATGKEELATLLNTKKIDIVLADFADAPDLEDLIQKSQLRPSLLPWVYQDPEAKTKVDTQKVKATFDAAKRRYEVALMAPLKPNNLLTNIDYRRELTLKQDEARAKASRPKTASR
jgi:hypothetical protein